MSEPFKPGGIVRRGSVRARLGDKGDERIIPLFDPRTTIPPRCAYCDTTRPAECLWALHRRDGGDLEGKQKPKTCLRRHDPSTAQLPEDY